MNHTSTEITMSSILALNPALVVREEEDGALLYDPDTGDVRILNTTALAVCKLLDGHRTVAGIMDALQESFEGMDAKAGEEVLELIRDLRRIGAVGTAAEFA